MSTFNEYLDENYPTYEIAGVTLYPSSILAETDPIAYREAELDWINGQREDFGTEVWMRFEADEDEEPTHEANISLDDDGDYMVEIDFVATSNVTEHYFDTAEEARSFLENMGYDDYTA